MKAYAKLLNSEALTVGKSFRTGDSGVIFTCKSIALIDGEINYNLELSNMLNDVEHTTCRYYKKVNLDRIINHCKCELVK